MSKKRKKIQCAQCGAEMKVVRYLKPRYSAEGEKKDLPVCSQACAAAAWKPVCAHCKEDPRLDENFYRPVAGTLLEVPLCDLHLKRAIIIDKKLLGIYEAHAYKQTVQTLKNNGIGAAI